MPDTIAGAMFESILGALDLPLAAKSRVRFVGDDRLPSCFPVSDLAVASVGAAAAAISELAGLAGTPPAVSVPRRLASLWFGWSIQPQGWEMPNPWDAVAGDYRTSDGWIKLHTNTPRHRVAALSVLGCKPEREAVAGAVSAWHGDTLEDAIHAAGGCAARLRSVEEWAAHPQGIAISAEPLIIRENERHEKAKPWQPLPERLLSGLRVLDLTRVLAGPVATRFLAGFGAAVLRIDPPDWDEPGVIPEISLGKHCARLDLKSPAGRAAFGDLLAGANILVHGFRRDALESLGLDVAAREAINPGLIDISLDAWGHSGPWAGRRGFDSLVQFSSGIAAAGMAWRGTDLPVSLPVQALDHATGYLMAAAAIRGVIGRITGAGPVRARLSLARTAKLLIDHMVDPTTEACIPARDEDFSATIEQSDWGPARRLLPPAEISGIAMSWTRPATRLGTSPAVWSD